MVKLQREHPLMDVQDFREATLPVANDDRMGVWVNGMREVGVLLFMCKKVPCFVVHEFPPETLVPLAAAPNPPTFHNFVDGTDIVYLVWHNEYQLLAEGQGWLDSLFQREDGQGEHMVTDPCDESRSSSIYMTSLRPWLPRPHQQFARMTVGGGGTCLASGALVSAATPEGSSKEDTEDSDGTESEDDDPTPVSPAQLPPVYVLSVPAAPHDRLAAPAVERRVIALDRAPWIVPPAIPPNWVGK